MDRAWAFHPWIPAKQSFRGDRLLLVGESHYADPYEVGLTQWIVNRYGVENAPCRSPFFRKTHLAFTFADPKPVCKSEFWNSVFFANYFQRIFDRYDQAPTLEDYRESAPIFEAVLNH